MRTWGEGVFANPHGVTIAPDGTVFCVDNGDSTVRQFTPDGKLLMTLGTPHKPSPKMSGDPFRRSRPCGLRQAHRGVLCGRRLLQRQGAQVLAGREAALFVGESGTGEGQFNIVHNVQVDNDGWVHVADRENHRIQVFNSHGRYEAQWGNLSRAAAIVIDDRSGEELMYIGEYFCGIGTNDIGTDLGPRVTVMTTRGQVLRQGRAARAMATSRGGSTLPRHRH